MEESQEMPLEQKYTDMAIYEDEFEKDTSTHNYDVQDELFVDYTDMFTTNMIFTSKEALTDWVKATGKRHNMIVVMKKSDFGQVGRKPRIDFACERYGSYKCRNTNKENEKRKRRRATGTKKCGCPFLLNGRKLVDGDYWILKVKCGRHNHDISLNLEGHSYAGRLTEKETSILVDMSKNHVRPKEILYTLKQNDGTNVSTLRHVYNARQKFRLKEQAGRTQMQQLMNRLVENKYIEWHRTFTETNIVQDLFWAHPYSIDLLRAFPRVIIMDCTYKTNRYRLPLLEIVGVTSTDLTFSIAFAYLGKECEENYTWALGRLKSLMNDKIMPNVIVTDRELALMKAIEKIFPKSTNILCRWHISKNVLAKTKKYFADHKDQWDAFMHIWNLLVLSTSIEEYKKNLNLLESNFQQFPQAINYVMNSWLLRYKEKFVAAWINLHMHLGNTTSNRAESAHAKLKRHLGSSQGNFDTSWTRIHALLELQHTDIKASFEKSLGTVQHNFKPTLFKELRGFTSRIAMNLIFQESKRADDIGIDKVACGCVIRQTHGLPCAHEISEYKIESRPIPLSRVHSHWKKLDLVPLDKSNTSEINCASLFAMIEKRYRDNNDHVKAEILQKLKEIASPSSTSLVEPQVQTKTKGRPSSKIDMSTRRHSSYFELVLSGQDNMLQQLDSSSTPLSQPTLSSQPPILQKQKVYRARGSKSMAYFDSFPIRLRPYIVGVKDVASDGNCGFRAVANVIGIGEDNWSLVRKDLIKELESHFDDYSRLYGNDDMVHELIHSLSHFDGSASREYWMTMPNMGHVIASRYKIILVHLSQQQCLTFLPLWDEPLAIASHKIVAIGFVNGCHFVSVNWHTSGPIPPFACNWYKYHHPCAEGWATAYHARTQFFRSLVEEEGVAISETIDLDKV